MRRERGFTLIELLIVVAILGIVAAIAIPNLISAINRGRQKRTMADMRIIGTAVEAYSVDHGFYPVADTIAEFKTHIDGPYCKSAPIFDGWRTTFVITSDSRSYTILSYGRDLVAAGGLSIGTTRDFDCDIGYSMGVFIQWPEGIQSNR